MSKIYQTRRRSETNKPKGSRVNWRKTRVSVVSCLEDSESGTSTPGTSSESEWEEDDLSGDEAPLEIAPEHIRSREGSEGEEVCAVSQSRRKRCSTTILTESSDSGSDVGGRPVRKLLPKKRLNLQLSDSDREAAEESNAEKETIVAKEAAKRRDRTSKLLELSKRRRARTSSTAHKILEIYDANQIDFPENGVKKEQTKWEREVSTEEDEAGVILLKDSSAAESLSDDDDEKDVHSSSQVVHSSEEEDEDSLKDFIVESDDQEGENVSSSQGKEGSLLSRHLPQFVTGSLLTHFLVVVKALLINALDETFLKSLYDGNRTKKYALEMKDSLYHLDERSILPRLENLKQRSRWSDRYKERVECYPKVRVTNAGLRGQSCQACELHRHCRFMVRLSGQLYDGRTLQRDEFMPDDTQAFMVGSVCASRTEVYHQLKHFKYHLFCLCQEVLKEEDRLKGNEEESVKDTVFRVLTRLQDCGWITKQYEKFQDYLNNADYFQEEKLD